MPSDFHTRIHKKTLIGGIGIGNRDEEYGKGLWGEVSERLTDMLRAGEGQSKKEAMLNGTDRDKIFSYETYRTYHKHCRYFVRWLCQNHPECTTLVQARKFVNEWLQARTDRVDKNGNHLSAWTVQTEAKALGKLYGITPDDPNYFHAPKRKRQDIRRSRLHAVRDRHFSVANNAEFVRFCRGTGCRRKTVEGLEGRDFITMGEISAEINRIQAMIHPSEGEQKRLRALQDAVDYFPNQDYFLHHRGDKGSCERYSPIVGKNKEQIAERMRSTAPNEKVWGHVPVMADIHSYRRDYAMTVYRSVARPIDEIPYDCVNQSTGKRIQSEVYVCRGAGRGKRLDKRAVLICSKALGYHRLETVANNYIRGH